MIFNILLGYVCPYCKGTIGHVDVTLTLYIDIKANSDLYLTAKETNWMLLSEEIVPTGDAEDD